MERNAPVSPFFWSPRRIFLTTIIVVLIAAGAYLFIHFRLVFFLLFTAIVLSTAIIPIVEQLEKWHIPRPIGMVLIALLALAVLVAFTLIVAPMMIEQGATITSLASQWYQQGHQILLQSSSLMLRRIARQLPTALPLIAPSPAPGQETNSLDLIQQAITIIEVILSNLLTIGAVALLAGGWILEGERTSKIVLLAFPPDQRETVRDFFAEAGRKVGAYTRGLAILSSVIGSLSMIAYLIIGLPNVLLLGILAGIFELIPLVGPLLASVPALIIAVSVDPSKVISVIIASVVIQLFENNLIVPRVMDRTVGVNPVVSLLAFLAFGALFGFVGALLAIPLAAVIQIMLRRFVFEAEQTNQEPPPGRDAISMLRYEAHSLMLDVRKRVRDKEEELTAGVDEIEDSMEAIAQDLDSILVGMEKSDSEQRAGGQKA